MNDGWEPDGRGVLALPSGRLVRGRGLRTPVADGPSPDFGLYLLGRDPGPMPWAHLWLRWRDFRLPSDRAAAREVLAEVWERAARERVEVACEGGRGRTGTALACVAVLDGVPPAEAVRFVRRHYDDRAVETPWQRRYVARFLDGWPRDADSPAPRPPPGPRHPAGAVLVLGRDGAGGSTRSGHVTGEAADLSVRRPYPAEPPDR